MRVERFEKSGLFYVVSRCGYVLAGPFKSAKAARRWIRENQSPIDPGGR